RRVPLLVVVLALEEDQRERLLRLGIMEKQHLRRRQILRTLALVHIASEVRHPLGANPIERHNAYKRHLSASRLDCHGPYYVEIRSARRSRRGRAYRAGG